jgi:hypothetical protein
MCDLFVSFSSLTILSRIPILLSHTASPLLPPQGKFEMFSIFSCKRLTAVGHGRLGGNRGRASTRKRAAASVRTTQDKNMRGKQEERTGVIVWNLARLVFLSTVLLPPLQDLQKGATYGVQYVRHRERMRSSRVLERLTANAVVATVLCSIQASSDTVESEGRQMDQC